MAKTKSPGSVYEPEVVYDVRLSRVVVLGRIKLLPRNAHELTGDALNEIVDLDGPDVIESATAKGK
jgi:hypothetical protein